MARIHAEARDRVLYATGSHVDTDIGTVGSGDAPKSLSPSALREKATAIEREFAPIQVARFECQCRW